MTWLSPAAPAPRALPILDIQNARAWSPGPKPCAKAAPVRAAKAGAARGALTGCCRVRRGLSPGDGCPLADASGGPVGDVGGEPGGDARSPLQVRLKPSHAAAGCTFHCAPFRQPGACHVSSVSMVLQTMCSAQCVAGCEILCTHCRARAAVAAARAVAHPVLRAGHAGCAHAGPRQGPLSRRGARARSTSRTCTRPSARRWTRLRRRRPASARAARWARPRWPRWWSVTASCAPCALSTRRPRTTLSSRRPGPLTRAAAERRPAGERLLLWPAL